MVMNKIERLKAFLEETPQDPFLHYALTMEYLKLDELDQARAGFEHLITTFPDYVGTYYHFGKFLESQGEKQRAIQIYSDGIKVANAARNSHAAGELQGALFLLTDLDDTE